MSDKASFNDDVGGFGFVLKLYTIAKEGIFLVFRAKLYHNGVLHY